MTKKHSAKSPHLFSQRLEKARQELAIAFLQAISEAGSSQEKASRELGVVKRTIGNWSRGETRLDVEVVLAAPRIGELFRVALCSRKHEHKAARK